MSATPAITFGSVCSGIEAASVAWAPLGWRAVWFGRRMARHMGQHDA